MLLAGAVAIGLSAFSAAQGQGWPTRPARVIVPFAPGGGSDLQGRLFARKFTESMGQSFVAENRSGAGGMVGAEIVAKAPPDGYSILFMSAALAVNTTLAKLSFDPIKDLAPVSRVSSVPMILVVHPSVPAHNVKEFVALAKRNKGKLNAASNGSGTTSHLAIEMLKQAAGIDVVHIPYKGGGAAVIAMMAGEVDFRFTTAIASLQHIRAGRVRPIAVTSTKPFALLPNMPTLASIYPGFEVDNWYAIFVPGATPKDVVAKLNAETLKALAAPDIRDAITKDGGEPAGSTPEELASYFRREVDKYAKVIRTANVQPE
jgi:tripartite-type tricarboxylate transporter receptor subunit TctC